MVDDRRPPDDASRLSPAAARDAPQWFAASETDAPLRQRTTVLDRRSTALAVAVTPALGRVMTRYRLGVPGVDGHTVQTVDLGRFRVGLRVEDVATAADFYRGLGFADLAAVSGPDGSPVMVMLQREGAMLIVDALEGMPFAATAREAQVKAGPRGLGVALGLGMDDLDAAYTYCTESQCEITSEPRVEPYGDRVFECIDPFGYLWEISQPVAELSTEDAVDAVREEWFGPNH